MMPPGNTRSLRRAQLRTILLLFGGYAACYYCRADLSVATPLRARPSSSGSSGSRERCSTRGATLPG
jgi:hypothetical protein